MALTGTTLGQALDTLRARGRQVQPLDVLAAGATDALRQAPVGLTANGAASFLATCAQESDYFRTTREYGSGQRYAPWIGRGFVQVTWQANYERFGTWLAGRRLLADPATFTRNPAALEDIRWAWLTAVWYFETNGLWRYANAGNHWAVSQGVNRGPGAIGTDKAPLHWDQRLAAMNAFARLGGALLPGAPTPAPATPSSGGGCAFGAVNDPATRAWQTWLRDNFKSYAGGLLVDGDFGEATRRATAEFQARVNITGPDADGRTVGPRTLAAARQLGYRG